MMGRQLVAYTVVGGTGALAYAAIATTLTMMGGTVWIVSTVCYALFIPVMYLAQRGWTFGSQNSHISSFPKYVVTQAFGLAIAAIVPHALVNGLGISAPIAYLFVLGIIAIGNFVVLKFWAFRIISR
jgi:putative flippase GtrA